MTRFLLLATFLLLILAGCAAPRPTELQQVQKTVARAYAEGADHLAPEHYQAASRSLRKAEESIRQDEEEQARTYYPLAEYHARQAIEMARREKVRIEKELREKERIAKQRSEAAANLALKPSSAKPEKPRSSAPKPETAEPKTGPDPVPLVNAYAVHEDDDTLWKISSRREVYGDPLLWPILYRANRDQIKDPRKIYSGQTLEVPRGIAEKDKDEARNQARQSEIFPLDTLLPEASAHNP